MNPTILFENDHILVINKPAGLVVHSDGKTDEPSVVDWILSERPEIQGVGEDMIVTDKEGNEFTIVRPGIVHRIDRETSGCLVIAKTQESFLHLKEQFKSRKVKKTYQALVYGRMVKDEGVIDLPIGKSKRDFRMKQAGTAARGHLRDAVTRFRVLERYEDIKKTDAQNQTIKYTLVELYPETGRTHQLRVHLKYIHYPIVSDSLYSGKRKPALGLARTALHAKSISFFDTEGTVIDVSSELANDISQALLGLTPLA